MILVFLIDSKDIFPLTPESLGISPAICASRKAYLTKVMYCKFAARIANMPLFMQILLQKIIFDT
jgi:hypothetical protein